MVSVFHPPAAEIRALGGLIVGTDVPATVAGVQAADDALPEGGSLWVPANTTFQSLGSTLILNTNRAHYHWPASSPVLAPAGSSSLTPVVRVGNNSTTVIGTLTGTHAAGLRQITLSAVGSLADGDLIWMDGAYEWVTLVVGAPAGLVVQIMDALPVSFAGGISVHKIDTPIRDVQLDDLHVKGNGNTGTDTVGLIITQNINARVRAQAENFPASGIYSYLNYAPDYDCLSIDCGKAAGDYTGAIHSLYDNKVHFHRWRSERSRSWSVVLENTHKFTGHMSSDRATSRGIKIAACLDFNVKADASNGAGVGIGVTGASRGLIDAVAVGNVGNGFWLANEASIVGGRVYAHNNNTGAAEQGDVYTGPTDSGKIEVLNADAVVVDEGGLTGVQWSSTAGAAAGPSSVAETSIIGAGVGAPPTNQASASVPSIPANYLKVGDVVEFEARGVWGSSGTPNLTVKAKFTDSAAVTDLLLDSGAVAVPSGGADDAFLIRGLITVRTIGASGTVISQGDCWLYEPGAAASKPFPFATAAVVTIDTTKILTFELTAQWGTSHASNSIATTNFSFRVVRRGGY